KCLLLFHGAPGFGGTCSFDGANHVAGGPGAGTVEFWLMDDPYSAVVQRRWQQCHHCKSAFFDGFADKGVCSARAGGPHESEGPNLSIRHYADLEFRQPDWRFCPKCRGLFFDGYQPNMSICPAGGIHEALGYNFILRFDGTDTTTDLSGWHYCS